MDALINNSHKFMLDRNQFVWHTSLSFSIAKIRFGKIGYYSV